jgi:hypothetical protein
MITGSRAYWPRIARSVSRPFITGISMSSVTRSGRSCSILAIATRPLGAVPTTRMSGSSPSASVIRRRMTTESSTTKTEITPVASSTRGLP